jgi:plasmid stability protein
MTARHAQDATNPASCYEGSETDRIRNRMLMNLSIKNVPEDVVRRLRQRAERRHRSLQGELLAIIDEAAQFEQELSPAELLAEVRRLGLRTPGDSAAIVRSDRDRR